LTHTVDIIKLAGCTLHSEVMSQILKVSVDFNVTVLYWWSGHGRAGTVSDDNNSLLPRCYGLHPHVRYHQRRLFQRCTGLVCVHSLTPVCYWLDRADFNRFN